MNIRESLAALRASWWLPLLAMVVGGALALGVSLLQTPLYTSSTQLFVSTTDHASSSDFIQGSQFSQQRVASYAQLLTGEELAGRVIQRLNLDMTPSELRGEIAATAVTDTVLINVTVTDRSAKRAQAVASALSSEFSTYANDLETPDGGAASPVKVTVTDRPEIPSYPSSPKTVRNLALGLLVGLLVGAGLAIARAYLDRSVKVAEEAAELAGAPVLGTILRDQSLHEHHTIDRTTGSRTAEDYRQLRTNLQFLNVDEPPTVIMVSSAVPSEGKTTIVVNLALALVDAGRSVTVVEADLRRPKVTRYMGLIGGAGLTSILAGNADIEDVVQTYREGLNVVGAGPLPPNPGELLGSSQMAAVVEKLRGRNDYVLIDAPPLLPVADSSALAVLTDGVLLSVRYGSTHKAQLQQAAATLDRVGAKTLGVILNIVPPKAEVASAYGYGYGYDGKHASG